MTDYIPEIDPRCISQEQADELFRLVQAKVRIGYVAATDAGKMSSELRLSWGQAYVTACECLEAFEMELSEDLLRIPWTIHTAGAPGWDTRFDCHGPDCENPWCGQVQKCSRCHDVLYYGFSAKGQIVDHMAMLMGVDIQEYMARHFGENPVDADGPTWFPMGTRIAKRSDGMHERIFLLDAEEDRPQIGPHEFFLDCEMAHAEALQDG